MNVMHRTHYIYYNISSLDNIHNKVQTVQVQINEVRNIL